MSDLDLNTVKEYQKHTFRINVGDQVKNPAQAEEFVNERGFVFLWPVKGVHLPSLWAAVAGDRPVPKEHDDPAHVTWSWKDQSLGKHIWYYAKILRYKATFVSLAMFPYFYALSENFGSPEEDYLISYYDGKLTLAEKLIYEALLQKGPMHTIELRQAAHLAEKSSDYSFNKALERLQSNLRVLPVGVAEAGAWNYAFIYDLTHRHFPDLVEKARMIGEMEARKKLTQSYYLSLGYAAENEVKKIFQWESEVTHKVLTEMVRTGIIESDSQNLNSKQPSYYLPSLKK
jgi:hypothetical protein